MVRSFLLNTFEVKTNQSYWSIDGPCDLERLCGFDERMHEAFDKGCMLHVKSRNFIPIMESQRCRCLALSKEGSVVLVANS